MGLMPGLGVGQRQQGQARRPQQTVSAGQQCTEQAQADTAEPPPRAEVQVPGHFGAVQTPQARRDIGQQQARQPIAAEHPGDPAQQGQRAQFDGQAGDQHPRTDATGAQGPQQTAALFQGQADGRVNDEQPHHEG
ncbi:hypothetical protein D3C76_1136770 [compost metagenome]